MNTKKSVAVLCVLGLLAAVIVVDLGFDFATGFTTNEDHVNSSLLPAVGLAMGVILMAWPFVELVGLLFQKPKDESPASDA